jgi:hypothetical protein
VRGSSVVLPRRHIVDRMGHYRGPVIPPCIGTGVQVCLTVAGPLTSGTWPAGPELLLSIRTLPYSSSCIAPVQLAYHVTVFITAVSSNMPAVSVAWMSP